MTEEMQTEIEKRIEEAARAHEVPRHSNCYCCLQSESDYENAFKEGAKFILELPELKEAIENYDGLKAKLEKAEAVISFYADMDSWRTTDGHKKYSTIDDDDLGTGEFEQPTGPNHFMNSVSDLDNGGRRAREYLKGEG